MKPMEFEELRTGERTHYVVYIDPDAYLTDIRHYETKDLISQTWRKLVEAILTVSIIASLVLCTALDSGDLSILWKALMVTLTISVVCALLLRIPHPKLPEGIAIRGGVYIITNGKAHPGDQFQITGYPVASNPTRAQK